MARWSAAQSDEALLHVVGVGVHGGDLDEDVARPGQFARPLVQIGQRVPLPQVEGLGPCAPQRGLQQLDRAPQVALVGQAPGGDQPALGHHFGARGGLAELGPGGLGLHVAVHGPVAVGDNGELVVAAGHLVVLLELPQRQRPSGQAIEGQAKQFLDSGRARRLGRQFAQHPQGVLVTVGRVHPRRVRQLGRDPPSLGDLVSRTAHGTAGHHLAGGPNLPAGLGGPGTAPPGRA